MVFFFNKIEFFLCIGICGFLLGCTKPVPETNYYFIDNPALFKSLPKRNSKFNVKLVLKDFTSVSPYNTENFVIKTRPSEIQFYNYEKWVSPPEEMLRNYLFQVFSSNPIFNFVTKRKYGKYDYEMDVEIQEFAQIQESGKPFGSIKISVSLVDQNTKSVKLFQVYQAKIASSSENPYDVVQALNHGVEEVSQKLLNDLEKYLALNE